MRGIKADINNIITVYCGRMPWLILYYFVSTVLPDTIVMWVALYEASSHFETVGGLPFSLWDKFDVDDQTIS